ncbi:MAG TPA: plasmid stabilization protein [Devosia sp.]|uniref:plasmid stabilization protein n=1 Tax=Devosia sp. TaxID=1871048 RepID=UPI002F93B1B1
MPQGDKSAYTDKQKRKAEHIEQGYEDRGVSHEEAERRAWATVNKDDGGGKKSGSGRGKHTDHPAAHNGGKASASRTAAQRSASAKKAAATRKRNQEQHAHH